MNNLKALRKLYEALNYIDPDIVNDVTHGYLTEHITRSGRPVFWYFAEDGNKAIYIDSVEFLTEDEIEKELC